MEIFGYTTPLMDHDKPHISYSAEQQRATSSRTWLHLPLVLAGAIRASQNPRFFRVQLRNQSLCLQSKLCFPMNTSFLGQNSHSLIVFHQPCMELPAFPAVLEVSHPKDAATWRQSVNLQCCPGYDSLPTKPTLGANGGRLKVLNTRPRTHKIGASVFFVFIIHFHGV